VSIRGDSDDCEVVARNQLPDVGRVVTVFQEFAKKRALPDAVRRRAVTAVDEVLNNVISYAYPEDGERVITIRFVDDRRRLTVTVQDDGVAFDPLAQAAPDASATLDEREVGGLGIHIVRRLASDVRYERRDEKNLLTIDFLYERGADG
jgi:serine/threonine-protein kinase RsbW